MKLESVGILISLRPMGERDALARIFTVEHGVLVGMMRGANVARKNRALTGQVGAASWNARLDSQLGVFHWEATHNPAVAIMMNARALMFMNAAFDLIGMLVPERVRYDTLYNETLKLLVALGTGDNMGDAYLGWEVALLRELGYALDLSHCSGCGRCADLHWLSPRTGRAVCDSCAAPYVSRLYKLPLNLDVTRRFLESVCAQVGADLPMSRRMFRVEK